MEIIFKNELLKKPKLSMVFLDWSCRESFHSIDYLNEQTIPREDYEIIWIEYYGRRSIELFALQKKFAECGRRPPIDKWIVMDMPDTVYYHKHLMYNVGILASKGSIITFSDSDAVFKSTFVESIIKSFEENVNIVLHMDEVRSKDRRFYPFNFPSIDDILNNFCINWRNGKTKGLIDKWDPIHTLNYGACMSALKADLIEIGGADEHIDYLGHICGPYEMTFRLVNAGKKEVWHQEEFLYHTWHPGTDGKNNYLGPHDGIKMSQGALSARRTKRILPFVENPLIRSLRLKEKVFFDEALFSMVISEENIEKWEFNTSSLPHSSVSGKANLKEVYDNNKAYQRLPTITRNHLFILRLKIFTDNVRVKMRLVIMEALDEFRGGNAGGETSAEYVPVFLRLQHKIFSAARIIRRAAGFVRHVMNWPNYVIDRCGRCLRDLADIGISEVAILGTGNIAQILCILSNSVQIKIAAVYDYPSMKKTFIGLNILPIGTISSWRGKVIIASFDEIPGKTEMLRKLVSDKNAIVDLW